MQPYNRYCTMYTAADGTTGVFVLLPSGKAGELISSHRNNKEAVAAIKRYEKADRRRDEKWVSVSPGMRFKVSPDPDTAS